jgi:hypothetical protein
MTYENHLRKQIDKALNWLEANPQRHITGTMATTGPDGMAIDANSPGATCFCAMGRILHEMGRSNYFADELLRPLGVPDSAVMALNDLTDGSHLARVEALRGLFVYAEGIPGLAKMTINEQAEALNDYMNTAMEGILASERGERKGFVHQKPLAS